MLTVPDLVQRIARYYPGEDSHQLGQRIRRWASDRFSDPIPSTRAPGGRNAALLFAEADWDAWWLKHREAVTGWRWVPLVIPDRRPTREEVEQALVAGIIYWLVSDRKGVRRAMAFTGITDYLVFISVDVQRPGEIWRALNPDGSPFMVEMEP